MEPMKATSVNSRAEELFVQLFCEAFGPEKTENLQVQYPCVDIYGRHRYIDFALESSESKIAIEIDGETYHNPSKVSENKYADDLLKQNSLIYDNWKVYRWIYSQLEKQPEKVKDELITFLGTSPMFKAFEADLPVQMGQTIELRDYQQEAIDNLKKMREGGKTIALLYHATGVGKTITAATDAKAVGGRTLFLVNALKLASQAKETFAKVWPEATLGEYTGSQKDMTQTVIFATVQSISKDLEKFSPMDFDYLIVDECHHAAANTYQKIFTYFHPKFILGLTATPERSDGEDMLELFQNVAHKMDLKTAVERGVLVPIRCIWVKTNIDLTDVRINGIKYNSQDLESKLFIPERNQLIVDTYLKYVNGKKTVIFCASVDHAAEIAKLLRDSGVKAEAVSGRDRVEAREKILKDYETGSTNVLCACDLLNEGWDSPHTTVLFMARPTMSKTIYLQQLGRGTRRCPGKDDLLVIDFVDNANMFNMPYSLHRVLDISKYQPMAYVLAPENKRKLDQDMLFQGEKPEAWLDVPIDVSDYEIIDLFNWQEQAKGMLSQIAFTQMVNVQSETIERYIRDGKIVPDMEVPVGEHRSFKFFQKSTVEKYAKEYGWTLITKANMKEIFLQMVDTMTMSYSYKPVFMLAFLDNMNDAGEARLEDVARSFAAFYEDRRAHGLPAEKKNCIFTKGGYSQKDVERLILSMPFKRYEDMHIMHHSKHLGTLQFYKTLVRQLTDEDYAAIRESCHQAIDRYFADKKAE